MSKTLDQFYHDHQATKFLRENLQGNIDVYCHAMSEVDREALMRVNIIMIRQCLQDFGVE